MSGKNAQDREKLKKIVGARLKSAREAAGRKEWTQEKICEKLYMKEVTSISYWENGVTLPRNNEVYKLYSEISGFSVPYLMGLTDYKTMRDEFQAAQDRVNREIKKYESGKDDLRSKFMEVLLMFCQLDKTSDEQSFILRRKDMKFDCAVLSQFDINLLCDGLSNIARTYIYEYIKQHRDYSEFDQFTDDILDDGSDDSEKIDGWWTPPDYYKE